MFGKSVTFAVKHSVHKCRSMLIRRWNHQRTPRLMVENDGKALLNLGRVKNVQDLHSYDTIVVWSNDDVRTALNYDMNVTANAMSSNDFNVEKATNVQILYSEKQRLVRMSVGKLDECDASVVRKLTHATISKLKELKVERAAVWISSDVQSRIASHVPMAMDAIGRVAVLSHAEDNTYKTKKSKSGDEADNVKLSSVDIGGVDGDPMDLDKSVVMASGTLLARRLANEQADVAHPQYLEDVAAHIAQCHSMKMQVVKGDALKDGNFHLIRAVGQARLDDPDFEPRIVVLDNAVSTSSNEEEPPIVLVGKGITFDTGGLNLKPTKFIEDMHADMGGAAAVLGAMHILGQLKVPRRVVGVLALAENAIDAKAYKPHAIIDSSVGSVEVGNTDAEGRLALASAFELVHQRYPECDTMVDVATLTGACVVALGEYCAGVFSNNNVLVDELVNASGKSGERVWHMPLLAEHSEEMIGTRSDYKSDGSSRYGGACTAAAFLKLFVPDHVVRWAHLDIAGPGFYSKQRDWMPCGGTGFGAQLLSDLVLQNTVYDN